MKTKTRTPDIVIPDRDVLLAELATRSLHMFLEYYAWPTLQPGVPFSDNWHLHAICEHLEAVNLGQIKRLIINVPFRSLKSTICSVSFPAWEWLRRPELAYLTSSYAMKVSTRDAVDTRRVIESPEYQRHWSEVFKLTGDQNEKTRYENNRRGMRTVTSTDASGTGFGGNRIVIDDPISAKMANSPVEIESSIEWWRGTGNTRLNNPEKDAIIVIHQRLAQRDLTGHLLAEESGWDHLVLPMRYSREHAKTTSLGFKDPRTYDGELLFPARIGPDAVQGMVNTLGSYHSAAQLDQRPDARAGILFQPDLIETRKVAPLRMRAAAGWDLAGTQERKEGANEGMAWTVRVLMGIADDGSFGILNVVRVRMNPDAVFRLIKSTSADDKARFPEVEISLPQDPGQAGKSQGMVMIKLLAGFDVEVTPESGDKVTRATPFASQVNHGNVWMIEAPWNTEFRDELRRFPGGKFKDQVDAASRAFNKLAGEETLDGILDYYAQRGANAGNERVQDVEYAVATANTVHTPGPKMPWDED